MRPARRSGFGLGWVGALLACLGAAPAIGGELELSAIAGWQQTGGLSAIDGSLDLSGGALFGVAFGWRVRPDGVVEIAWSHQEVEASTDGWDDGPEPFAVLIDTVELGGLWETRPGRMRPFLGLALGTTRLAGSGADLGDGWWFSGSISGGIRYELGPHALLRLEARGTGILLGEGGAIACTSPSGQCSVALSGSLLGAVSLRVGVAARF